MIEHFTPKNEYSLGRTTGCDCCSGELTSKEKVMEEVRDNIRVVKEVSEYYKIPLQKLMKDVLTSKKCRKHKPYKKYDFKGEEIWHCWKCDIETKRVKKEEKT